MLLLATPSHFPENRLWFCLSDPFSSTILPFIQLLNLLLYLLSPLFVSFCFETRIPFVLCRLHFVGRGDWYNFHRYQSIGLSSLESLSKWAKPQGLSRRCDLKQLKSTEVFKYVPELLKAPCLLFEVQWPLGHFLLFMPCTSLRQYSPGVEITLVPCTAVLEWGEVSNQDNFPSKKIAPTQLEEWFLVDTVPVQVLGKVLTRERHSEPGARCWLRPPAHAECHTSCGDHP